MMSEVGTVQLTEGQLKAERYVASNRFRLQANKGPVFEKRWAERKSRLANLDGFRFFTLMRRVEGSPRRSSLSSLPRRRVRLRLSHHLGGQVRV